MADVNPIPSGFHTITPHLVVKGAADAIEFYREAFGAEETLRMVGPGGSLSYAELRIGDSLVMLADEFPRGGALSPDNIGGTPVTIHMYVEDVDEVFEKAVAAGAEVILPVGDQFWGDRYGRLEDPFGHRWSIATRKENLTPEQIMERAPTMGA